MAKRVRYLTDAELEIMRMVWDSDNPMDSTMIQKGLTYREWKLSTLMGALKRLELKGYIKRDVSGYRIMYSASISESQYLVKVFSNMCEVHNILKIKPEEVVSCLYENNILSIEQSKKIHFCLESITDNSK